MLIKIFNTILYQPLLNILILFYLYVPGNDFGVAIILLTIFIKLILYPLGSKAIKSQKALSLLQPKIKEIQEKYKEDKEKQTKEIMGLYKKEKINPFSGCLSLLIQLPILIALYRVFWTGLKPEQMGLLYSFISSPGAINTYFFGLINLAEPSLILAVMAGLSQFIQIKMVTPPVKLNKNSGIAEHMQKQTQFLMPIFMVVILLKLPAAVGLYWITTTLFTIIQQYYILRHNSGDDSNS